MQSGPLRQAFDKSLHIGNNRSRYMGLISKSIVGRVMCLISSCHFLAFEGPTAKMRFWPADRFEWRARADCPAISSETSRAHQAEKLIRFLTGDFINCLPRSQHSRGDAGRLISRERPACSIFISSKPCSSAYARPMDILEQANWLAKLAGEIGNNSGW